MLFVPVPVENPSIPTFHVAVPVDDPDTPTASVFAPADSPRKSAGHRHRPETPDG